MENGKSVFGDIVQGAFAICFTGKKLRAEYLKSELSRVGIRDYVTIWTFPNPFRSFLLSRIPHIGELDDHPGAWGATIGNYIALKTAYELRMERAMIMEDDCRFLNSVEDISRMIRCAPSDFDVLMLDHFGDRGVTWNRMWRKCSRSWSTACYIVNRKAMCRIIDMYESPVSGRYKKPVMRNSDHWFNVNFIGSDIKIYCSMPNIAVQCDCHDTTNYNKDVGNALQISFYEKNGIDISKYHRYEPDYKIIGDRND